MPDKGSCAPFDRVIVPEYACPAMALGVIFVVAGNIKYWVSVPLYIAPKLHEPDSVYAVLDPIQVMDREVTEALTVPELRRVR